MNFFLLPPFNLVVARMQTEERSSICSSFSLVQTFNYDMTEKLVNVIVDQTRTIYLDFSLSRTNEERVERAKKKDTKKESVRIAMQPN